MIRGLAMPRPGITPPPHRASAPQAGQAWHTAAGQARLLPMKLVRVVPPRSGPAGRSR